MPPKITSKNLTYDTTLPPFLARLRGQADVASSSGPDPLLAARRRIAIRNDDGDDEDAPLVVDGEGNVVGGVSVGRNGTVREAEAGNGHGAADAEADSNANVDTERAISAGKVAGIGAAKKRKVGRVVGADEDADEDAKEVTEASEKGGKRKGRDEKKGEESGGARAASATTKAKKKAKKIKLSFGDDEG